MIMRFCIFPKCTFTAYTTFCTSDIQTCHSCYFQDSDANLTFHRSLALGGICEIPTTGNIVIKIRVTNCGGACLPADVSLGMDKEEERT